jgi:hypothetical protein
LGKLLVRVGHFYVHHASTVDIGIRQDHWTEEPLTAADREKKKNNRPEKLNCPTLTSNLPQKIRDLLWQA